MSLNVYTRKLGHQFKKKTLILHTDSLSSAWSNWLVRAYFQRLIFYHRLTTSLSTPPIERCVLSQARVPDGADKPVTQVTATPLPAVCGDPRGSRPRRSHSSCDWTAGWASDSRMEHLVVSHRRCSEWSDVWGAGHTHTDTAMRTKEGKNEGNWPLFSNSPVGLGLCVSVRPNSTGKASPLRALKRGYKLARKQRRGGYLVPTKSLSHISIPNPWRPCGISS